MTGMNSFSGLLCNLCIVNCIQLGFMLCQFHRPVIRIIFAVALKFWDLLMTSFETSGPKRFEVIEETDIFYQLQFLLPVSFLLIYLISIS